MPCPSLFLVSRNADPVTPCNAFFGGGNESFSKTSSTSSSFVILIQEELENVSNHTLKLIEFGTHVVAVQLLLLVQLGVKFVDTRSVVGWITTESDVEVLQEFVATSE